MEDSIKKFYIHVHVFEIILSNTIVGHLANLTRIFSFNYAYMFRIDIYFHVITFYDESVCW